MRKILALAFCFGCSSGSERTFEGVQAVDRATLENHVYYIDLSVADTPLTSEEVQDAAGAIPVRLLANERLVAAVAIDPTMGPSMGPEAMDRLMGVWKVNRDLVPNGEADGHSVPGSDPTTTTHEPRVIRPDSRPGVPVEQGLAAELVIDWDADVIDLRPDELDRLIDFHFCP